MEDEAAEASPPPSSLLASSRRGKRPPPRARTLSLSFSPIGERVSGDGSVGPAGIAITVGVVREEAGNETDDSDFDGGDFDDDESDSDEDVDPSIRPVIEAADRFESEMDQAFREEERRGGGEGDDSPALRAALALGVDVSAFDDCNDDDAKKSPVSSSASSSTITSPAEARLLWGGPVPGLTALHSCEEAGGDAVLLKAPPLQRREEPLLSSSAPPPSPPPTLFVDGDMRKLLAASSSYSSSSSSSSSTVRPLLARVFVGTSLWAPGQLEREVAAGAWAVASPPPQSLLSVLAAPRFGESEEEGDGRVLWERSLGECGLGAWARVPEEAVEEASRVGF